ncbi:hypothetical protein V6N13_001372 [Hibiscus sabdariffa]|uniref:non-specific serine/threonine protein kinase n=2 Tax=Hibiscus sabdariffa TaxID=183260 RepID=A0ABR2G9L8_9ROSI
MVMDNPSSPPLDLDLENLKAIKILGKRAMGYVFLVHHTSIGLTVHSSFALKVVQRSQRDVDCRAHWEMKVLTKFSSPNPTLHHSFPFCLLGRLETLELFAWVVPYCLGSNLNVLHHRESDCFSSSLSSIFT